VKLGGIAGAVGETQLSDIQSQRITSDWEAYFEGDTDHWRSQTLRSTDSSLYSNQKGVFVWRKSHARFNSFTEQRLLPVQASRVAFEDWQSNRIPAWRSETPARIREWGSNVTDVRE
jgi:hypothetical protein